MVVLSNLRNDSNWFYVFVINRIQAISELTDVTHWLYIPKDENPVDRASRSYTNEGIMKSNWTHGPAFLWAGDLSSRLQCSVPAVDPANLVIKAASFRTKSAEDQPSIPEHLSHFSKWNTMIQVVCRFL